MAVSDDYCEFVLEQLRLSGRVTSRPMFGGIGLYLGGLFFALIDDDTLYFRSPAHAARARCTSSPSSLTSANPRRCRGAGSPPLRHHAGRGEIHAATSARPPSLPRAIPTSRHRLHVPRTRPGTHPLTEIAVWISDPWVLKIAKEPISMETPIGDDEDSHLGDFIEDSAAESPLDSATVESLRETVHGVLSQLTPREAQLLRRSEQLRSFPIED